MNSLLLLRLFYSILICLISNYSFAQLSFNHQLELETSHVGDNYSVLPLSSGNVLLYFQELTENGTIARIVLLDDRLEVKWDKTTALASRTKLIGFDDDFNEGFVLLESIGNEYVVLKIGLQEGEIKKLSFPNKNKMVISHFKAVNGYLIAGGTLGEKACAVKYRPNLGMLPSILFHNFYQKSELKSINVDEEAGVINFLLTSASNSFGHVVFINNYDLDLHSLGKYKVDMGANYHLLSHQVGIVSKNELIIMGDYSLNNTDDHSNGVYSIYIDNQRIKAARYYDFGRLNSYFNFLDERQKEKALKKRSKNGKKNKYFSSPYYVKMQSMTKGENNFIITANAHKRHLRDRNYSYNYLGSFACAFDREGRLAWDNSIPYKGLPMVRPEPFDMVVSGVSEGKSVLVQKLDEVFRYKITATKDSDDQMMVQLGNHIDDNAINDFVMDEKLLHLYGGKFLLYSVKEEIEIKNPAQSRIIFSISSFEAQAGKTASYKKI